MCDARNTLRVIVEPTFVNKAISRFVYPIHHQIHKILIMYLCHFLQGLYGSIILHIEK